MTGARSNPDPRISIPHDVGLPIGSFQVQCSVASLYQHASLASSIDTQLLYGERFTVYREQGPWVWGQAISPVPGSPYKGYMGYLRRSALGPVGPDPNSVVSALKAPVFARPDIKSRIRTILPLGSQLATQPVSRKTKNAGNFLRPSMGGYIHRKHVRLLSEPVPSDFVHIAEQHLGLPYIWGGISTDGLDCSGLVLSALRATGLDAPRDTDQQEVALGQSLPIKTNALKRGDLIFWAGHVGIMKTPEHLLHANAFHMCVSSEPLETAVERIGVSSGPVTAIKRLG